MFWSSPSGDLSLALLMMLVFLAVSLIVLFFTKRLFLFIFLISLFSNAVWFLNVMTNSRLFKLYNLEWLKFFSIYIWPYINLLLFIALIINFIKNKKDENKNKKK